MKGQKDQLKDITRRKATAGAHSELAVSQNQPAIEVILHLHVLLTLDIAEVHELQLLVKPSYTLCSVHAGWQVWWT